MNLHEYQAKELFTRYGIPVPAGRIARTPDEAAEAAIALGGTQWVGEAQIPPGGHGKACGVQRAQTPAAGAEAAPARRPARMSPVGMWQSAGGA